MSKADYYDTLGVSSNADAKVLKSAFRKKAMGCHPDRNPGDAEAEARFKDLNEAYEVLKSPQKRAAYDRFGHSAFENGGGNGRWIWRIWRRIHGRHFRRYFWRYDGWSLWPQFQWARARC